MHYSRNTPFFAHIKERKTLSPQKNTQHIVLDLKRSSISYKPGDCVAILPRNPPEIVHATLQALQTSEHEHITHPKTQEQIPLGQFLSSHANLSRISKGLVQYLAERRPQLSPVLADKEAFKDFQACREVWDLLGDHPGHISAKVLIPYLSPLLPRFYSIASSMLYVGEELHITVRHVQYTTNSQRRFGICTHYLCDGAPLGEPIVPLYIQPSHSFQLTTDLDVPLILIGPGTGVAPHRALLQERKARGAKGPNWLFFGEWTRTGEFFYQEFWEELVADGLLQIDTAFSRDQEEKIYVQHRMWQKRSELFRWIQQGAHIYLCGDAQKMAPDVEETLARILQIEGAMSQKSAQELLKQMRKEKRYLKDCY